MVTLQTPPSYQDSAYSQSLQLPSAAIEREVKFAIPADDLKRAGVRVSELPKVVIEQHYFPKDMYERVACLYGSLTGMDIPEDVRPMISQARIRKTVEDGAATYELTMKSPRNSLGLGERIELPAATLSEGEYGALRAFATAGSLTKERYFLTVPAEAGVTVELDVVRGAGVGKRTCSFGEKGWEIVTIDVEAVNGAALQRVMENPGSVHPVLARALNVEEFPKLRRAIGATSLAEAEKGRDGFEDLARAVRRRLN